MSSHIPSNVVAGLLVLPILVGLGKTEAPSERIGKEVVAASLAAIVDWTAVAQDVDDRAVIELGFGDIPLGGRAWIFEEVPVLVGVWSSDGSPEPARPGQPRKCLEPLHECDGEDDHEPDGHRALEHQARAPV